MGGDELYKEMVNRWPDRRAGWCFSPAIWQVRGVEPFFSRRPTGRGKPFQLKELSSAVEIVLSRSPKRSEFLATIGRRRVESPSRRAPPCQRT